MNVKVVCSACSRPAPGRTKCMYCGAATREIHTAVVGGDDPAAAVGAKLDAMRAAQLTPAQRKALFDRACDKVVALVEAGRAEEALAAFDEALAIETAPHLLLAKAQHQKQMGRHAPALATLEQALAIDRALVDAWFEKADLLETQGRLPESLAAYDAVLALAPRHARAHCDRGHVLGRMGRLPEALDAYTRALAIDGASLHAWFNKANAEASLGQVGPARDSFRRFLALGPPPGLRAQADYARQMLAKLGG
ncbi:MAG TPA: tetratricopeptide repeat protein [Polyangiaceae bacterium]|nr:tetratricopeptide repeat protein [Polyangiaceae bacterium]